jgi:hypothetical protein
MSEPSIAANPQIAYETLHSAMRAAFPLFPLRKWQDAR